MEVNCLRSPMSSQPEDDVSCFIICQGAYSVLFILLSCYLMRHFIGYHDSSIPLLSEARRTKTAEGEMAHRASGVSGCFAAASKIINRYLLRPSQWALWSNHVHSYRTLRRQKSSCREFNASLRINYPHH